MKLKKLIPAIVAATVAPALTSCLGDTPETKRTLTNTVYNMVVPIQGGQDRTPTLAKGTYAFQLSGNKAVINTVSLRIGSKDYSFTTEESAYVSSIVMIEGDSKDDNVSAEVLSFKGYSPSLSGDSNLPVKDLSAVMTPYYYYDEVETKIKIHAGALLMHYNIGQEYVVRTFSADACYKGETATTFTDAEGDKGEYKNSKIVYRVILDVDKMTADVYIYQAKFAEQAPSLSKLLLENLAVTITADGYTVEGSDVVPKMVEGDTSTPVARFPFNTFRMTTTGDMMNSAVIEYTVAGRYAGYFTGAFTPAGN